jgi:hypothetical protein
LRKPVPDRDAPMVDSEGRITPSWLEYLKDLESRAFREKVSATAPANGEVMTFNTSTNQWEPA